MDVLPLPACAGPTINAAARMESSGFPGCVHVSADFVTAAVAHGVSADRFRSLGLRPIKGLGKIETFLVKGGDEWQAHVSPDEGGGSSSSA